jgi:hypothetical protein
MFLRYGRVFGVGPRAVLALASLLVLASCTVIPTWSARVTSYQQWPPDAVGKTYRIVPEHGQPGNLQFQTFADMVRANIGRTGLVEAAPGQRARFDVSLEYGNPVTNTWTQQYADPYFYNGYGPWGGYYRGWGGGAYYAPPVVNVPVQVYNNFLTVIIRDSARGNVEVYRSGAQSESPRDNLLVVMPYLARAVFDGFPGNNGQVRVVQYQR